MLLNFYFILSSNVILQQNLTALFISLLLFFTFLSIVDFLLCFTSLKIKSSQCFFLYFFIMIGKYTSPKLWVSVLLINFLYADRLIYILIMKWYLFSVRQAHTSYFVVSLSYYFDTVFIIGRNFMINFFIPHSIIICYFISFNFLKFNTNL